jgi:hypothetical protein
MILGILVISYILYFILDWAGVSYVYYINYIYWIIALSIFLLILPEKSNKIFNKD